MFYDNAIPFVFAESESFKQFCKSLRPAYQPPSRKQIAGPLLDQDFAQILRLCRKCKSHTQGGADGISRLIFICHQRY